MSVLPRRADINCPGCAELRRQVQSQRLLLEAARLQMERLRAAAPPPSAEKPAGGE